MKKVIALIENLKLDPISETVQTRMREFDSIPEKGKDEIFRELSFCILTAGTSAELGLKTIDHIGDVIFSGTEKEIQKKLKQVYRFYNLRANYLHLARSSFQQIDLNSKNIREDLVKNIKGLGMKEASHFLRNIGHKDVAIIDFHIVDFLVKNDLLEKPKTLNKKKYLEIESLLREIAGLTGLSLGELDLYIWYAETGKVLK